MMANIIIYSTPTCPYCVKVKEYLKSKDISYTDYDISKDRSKVDEMMKKSGQMGVPVIDIDGNIILGFDKNAIDSALGMT
jgi:glutaredoxin 3